VIGLASRRVPQTKILLKPSIENWPFVENTDKVLPTSIHGLIGQQHLKSHSKSGISGHILKSAQKKRDQSHLSATEWYTSLKQWIFFQAIQMSVAIY